MKKIIIFLFALISVFALSSCSNKDDSDSVLKVGIDLSYPPFSYLDGTKEMGLEPEVARAYAEYLGKDIEIVNTRFEMLIPALESGDVDVIIADMTVTEQRSEVIDFSDPYRFGKTAALVNKQFYDDNNITDDMPTETFLHLAGIKIIGIRGTLGTVVPESYNVPVTTVERSTAIAEITSGANANVRIGSYDVFGDHTSNPTTTEIYKNIPYTTDSAFAFKLGSDEEVKVANEFIKTLFVEGGLYEEIAPKYDQAISDLYGDESIGFDYIVRQ